MRSIEASGKTVKDAIRSGLVELGCDSDDVDIQVIEMGSPGLFGMFGKPAKVRLTVKADDPALDIEMPVLSLDAASGKKQKPEKRKAEKPAAKPEKPAKAEKPAEKAEEAPVVLAPVLDHEPFVPTDEAALSDEAKRAREFLSGLTQRMGVPVEIELQQTEEQLRMQMAGEGMSLLIGRRGETLDALQYLTSLNINRGREEYLRVSIDTENYRAKREEALRKLAVRMAGRAKKSGRRVALEPMNPYERRILHSALQNDPEVTTHSEGEEPYRRVIITLK